MGIPTDPSPDSPFCDSPQAPALVRVPVVRMDNGVRSDTADLVAEEVPVALVYNGISHAVMMATPRDLDDFALGFSLTEGILAHPGELYDLDVSETCNGVEIRMDIAARRFDALKTRRRALTGRTGCGLCGVDSLDALAPAVHPLAENTATTPFLSLDAIDAALRTLRASQTLHDATGATHATAWADDSGTILAVREDVGRHNALDKLIGFLARRKTDISRGFVLTSSRASYEMVQKTTILGAVALIAISAPTAMAVRLAQDSGLTLAGFARGGRLVIYSGAERVR